MPEGMIEGNVTIPVVSAVDYPGQAFFIILAPKNPAHQDQAEENACHRQRGRGPYHPGPPGNQTGSKLAACVSDALENHRSQTGNRTRKCT